MGRIIAHDIVVHYMGNTVRIPNVDPENYQYIDLLGDVTDKAMNDLPGNLNMLVHMKCVIPRTTSFMDISSDKSVSDMFKLHEQDLVINLYLLHLDIIPTTEENMVDNRNNQLQDAQKDKGIEKAPILVVDSEGDDEIYASSSDDSWKDDMDSDLEDVIAEDRALISSSDKEENDLSDYEEIEDAQVVPDSESDQESDPMRAIMLSKMWTYNPREDIEFEKGMLFTNVDAFRAVLKDYAIQKGFPLVRLKNEKSRCTAKCGAEGCNWRIHASPVADTTTFMVKTYTPEHTCVMDRKNSEATSDWIAKKLISVMRDHPEMTSKGVKAEMQKHGVLPSRMQIYRAKKKALEQIEGSHSEAYGRLPKYAELLRINNPGSIMKIHYDRPNLLMEPKFLRLFISFKAQRDGFLAGCRPFIGFDGCHLKGAFGGILLTAVALDGNNSLFPLAFAVVECENKEAWSWFFYYFQDFFGPFPNNIPLTFMSDRQKGLNLAYEEQVPQAAARYCDWHIYSNFKVKFPGLLLRRFFWQAAKSYDLIGHNEAMEKIKNINIDAWKYLANIPKCNWARHAFSIEIKCDHVTNNFTESFNAWVGELRGKNILALADGLRQKFMKKLHKRYQKGCTWTSRLTPHVTGKLKDIASESRKCSLTMASENTFEVTDVDKSYIVKLHERTCECGAFQLTGIPCKHAALGAIYRREKLESYCDAAFSRDQYLKTYAFMINPIPHMNRWPPMEDVTPAVVLPPPLRRRAGRPRRNRRRAPDEGAPASQHKRSISFRCSKCGAFGHNRRTCQGAPIAEKRGSSTSANQVAERRGRPGRGIANTGLAGSVLWEHAQGNVPVIVSSQGSNGSTQNQTAGANVQLTHSASTSTNTRKRGGPNAWVGTTVANNNKRARRNTALNPHQTPAVTASATAPTVTASSISTSATTTGTHNDNSSISMWF